MTLEDTFCNGLYWFDEYEGEDTNPTEEQRKAAQELIASVKQQAADEELAEELMAETRMLIWNEAMYKSEA